MVNSMPIITVLIASETTSSYAWKVKRNLPHLLKQVSAVLHQLQQNTVLIKCLKKLFNWKLTASLPSLPISSLHFYHGISQQYFPRDTLFQGSAYSHRSSKRIARRRRGDAPFHWWGLAGGAVAAGSRSSTAVNSPQWVFFINFFWVFFFFFLIMTLRL